MSFETPRRLSAIVAAGLALLLNAGCNEQAQDRGPRETTADASASLTEPLTDLSHLEHPPADPRAALESALRSGALTRDTDDNQFLKEVLEICGVPIASQVLVFSKTSLQTAFITPTNPRAVYFSDDFYIGFVPGGLIEISDTDPDHGTGFYSLYPRGFDKAAPFDTPIVCLNCHESSRTRYAPGLLVRSVYPDADGFPIGSAGSFVTSHASPLEERWGGWYVTGLHGSMRHMGNVIAQPTENGATLDKEAGANRLTLDDLIQTDRYLAPGSDIVALMVLEHQVVMHNLLTQSALAVDTQTFRSQRIVESTGETFDPHESETLMSLVNNNAHRIVKHMLFVDEIELTDTIQGDRAFARQFRANRRENAQEQSLKDFDLNDRLFRYRCSYMLYARSFDLMPDLLKQAVYRELYDALTTSETENGAHLETAERETILEIIRQTKGGLPEYWGETN